MTAYAAAVAAAAEAAAEAPEWARAQAFALVLDHALRQAAPLPVAAGSVEPPPQPPDTRVGVAEFLAGLHQVDSHPGRVVAIAYWHEARESGRGISTKDLMDAYQRARLKRPQNFPDVIASCMRRGLLVEAGRRDGMKRWAITQSGARLIEGR